MVGAVFIFPIVFSSIDAAWQASALMPSAYQRQKKVRREIAREPESVVETEEEEAVAEPVIPEPEPEPEPPAPSFDEPLIGQPLQL